MDKAEKRPFSSTSKLLFFVISILSYITIAIFVIFVLLRALIVYIAHAAFDKDYIGSLYKSIDESLWNILTIIIGEHYPDTSNWGHVISDVTSNNSMNLVITLLVIIGILIALYSVTILLRHHNGEMAPFFNDLEAKYVRREMLKSLRANLIKITLRKKDREGKVSRVERISRRRFRRKTKVDIFTKIEKGQPKPVKTYKVSIKAHGTKEIKDHMRSKLKDFHFELASITNDISFDDMKTSTNKRYFIFDGAKEVNLKEARSVVKARESKENPNKNINERTTDTGEYEGEFPLTIFEDNSSEIEAQEIEAKKYAESKVAKISTYFSSIDMSLEYLKCNVGKTAIEYVYSNRFGNSTKSESSLQQDLSVELANSSVVVRIESKYIKINLPLPENKRVEIDTRKTFRDNLSNPKEPTDTIWGLTVENEMFVAPLAESPHILAAGMTGSGKSVWLNSVLIGMLYHSTPKELRLGIVDPKRNEFVDYKGLPHNIADPITDMADAETFLRYTEQLAEERYKLFEKTGKKNIYKYNKWAEKNGEEKLPFIVVLVDEWNNLRKQSKDCEKPLEGLGEKARAAGVHVIVATQRPSTDVITGTIRGNLPTKVAFSVDTAINSRIILEKDGAEKLNGRGDMYIRYKASDTLIRAQGLNIKDEEITAVTDHLKEKHDKPVYVDYKAYMRRFDGEDVEDEEENPQFQAATALHTTREGFESEKAQTTPSNSRKTANEITSKEKSVLERAKAKSEERKRKQQNNNQEDVQKKHKEVRVDPMEYFNSIQDADASTDNIPSKKESKSKNTQASTEDILGL